MSSNIVNTMPYLRTSREYPQDDVHLLSVELSRTYIDVALAVNNRTIGIYPTKRPALTGNNYFFTSQRQESQRQMYSFETTADIPLGFKLSSIYSMIQMYGTYKDSTGNTYGLIAGTSVPIAGQISFFVFVDATSTKTDLIRFELGGGEPAIASGIIVLEWILKL